jgi:hypothetical protein
VKLFQISGFFTAAGQFRLNLIKGNPLIDHEHHQVVKQVADLPNGFRILLIFSGNNDLAALFPAFF